MLPSEAAVEVESKTPQLPSPRFQEMMSVASLNGLGKVVPVLPPSSSRFWTQNPFS